MQTYRVDWSIDIEAASPEEAAKKAMELQQDQTFMRRCFMVWDHSSKGHYVEFNPTTH